MRGDEGRRCWIDGEYGEDELGRVGESKRFKRVGEKKLMENLSRKK